MKNKNFKKRQLPGDRRFWPSFPPIIECDKFQAMTYKGLKRLQTNTAEVMNFFL